MPVKEPTTLAATSSGVISARNSLGALSTGQFAGEDAKPPVVECGIIRLEGPPLYREPYAGAEQDVRTQSTGQLMGEVDDLLHG